MCSFDSTSRAWFGPKIERKFENRSFRQNILHHLRLSPKHVFEISADNGTRWTYSAIEIMSIRVAQNMRMLGVADGRSACIILPQSIIYSSIVIGCILAGSTIIPVVIDDIDCQRKTLATARPKVLIVQEMNESLVAIVRELKLNVIVFVAKEFVQNEFEIYNIAELLDETGDEKNFKFNPEDDIDIRSAFIIPSSPTSGEWKLVDHRGSFCNLMKYCWNHNSDVTMLSFNGLHLQFGIMSFLFCIFNNGTRITTKKSFSPKAFGEIIRKLKVTNAIISSSDAIELSNSTDFKSSEYLSLKEVLCVGGKLSVSTTNFLDEHLPHGSFHTTYKLTELCVVASNNDHSDTIDVGCLRPNVKCKILNESGEALDVDQIGEIVLKSEFIFAGYHGDTELTKKVKLEDSWFRTGDVGFMDSKMHLHVLGRLNCNAIEQSY